MGKKVLIVCYSFPPFPGIGGRRWAKFSKHLKRKGNEVYVIACQNPSNETSQWINDTQGINVTYLPFKYPKSLTLPKSRHLWDKFLYRLSLLFVKLADKGNHYDRTIFWEKQLIQNASKLIVKNKIKNIIVSGAPFRLTYYCTKLKSLFPQINLITDYRDLWTTDTSISGFSALSARRQAYERMLEKTTVEKSDIILTVADKMRNYFNDFSNKTNCHTLINGFDEEDFSEASTKNEIFDPGKINLVYTGTLYINIENIFIPFLEALIKIKNQSKEQFELLSFHFYGIVPESIKQLIKQYSIDTIKIYGTIDLDKIPHIIKNSTACMLFLADSYDFSLSTKFYEYVSQRKKIILFSRKGETSNFIAENQLGYWIDPNATFEELLNIIDKFKNKQLTQWTSTININNYSVKNLTQQLEKYLI